MNRFQLLRRRSALLGLALGLACLSRAVAQPQDAQGSSSQASKRSLSVVVEGKGVPEASRHLLQEALETALDGDPVLHTPTGASLVVALNASAQAWCAESKLTLLTGEVSSLVARCVPVGRSLLGTETYSPKAKQLKELIAAPLAAEVSRKLAAGWTLKLSNTHVRFRATLKERDITSLFISNGDWLALLIPPGERVRIAVGSCIRELDQSGPALDLSELGQVRRLRVDWASQGVPVAELITEEGQLLSVTLTLTEDPSSVLSLRCSGPLRATLAAGGPEARLLTASSVNSWTWEINPKQTSGTLAVSVLAADSDPTLGQTVTLAFHESVWKRWWVKLLGAVGGIGALIAAIVPIVNNVRGLLKRDKKDEPEPPA